jgi:hypothetical protein
MLGISSLLDEPSLGLAPIVVKGLFLCLWPPDGSQTQATLEDIEATGPRAGADIVDRPTRRPWPGPIGGTRPD